MLLVVGTRTRTHSISITKNALKDRYASLSVLLLRALADVYFSLASITYQAPNNDTVKAHALALAFILTIVESIIHF